MAVFYSPSRKGFFDNGLHQVMPPDVVPVTDAQHQALLAAQGQGLVIVADANGVPQAVAAAAVVPPPAQAVTAFQCRAALHAQPGKTAPATLLDDANAAVAALATSNPVAAMAWEYSTTVQRQSPLVLGIASTLGLTSAQVDALFAAAAAIVV